jgi:hypothetical protein
MNKSLLFVLLFSLGLTCFSNVVRLAPNITWDAPARSNSIRSVKGQPVVLVIAKSPKSRAFRKQVDKLSDLYHHFSSRQVVFVAAFTEEEGLIRSDIPFVIANNGAKVAADYEVTDSFAIIVIGKDGNVDLQTNSVCPAERVRDVIENSFVPQAAQRK